MSLSDELVVMVFDQRDPTMDGVNNLVKKKVSCKDNLVPNSLRLENIIDCENMGNTVENLYIEELHGKQSHISKDGMQGSVCKSGFDSRS